MNSITAENRECWHSRNQSTKGIPPRTPPQAAPGTGYYLALTFGTLLSSQGADAQQLHPHGLHCWLGVQRAPVSGSSLTGSPVRRPSRAARRRENITRPSEGSARGPERRPSRPVLYSSGDAPGAELHAHPWPHRLRGLGDAVLPRALAGAAHDHEVA